VAQRHDVARIERKARGRQAEGRALAPDPRVAEGGEDAALGVGRHDGGREGLARDARVAADLAVRLDGERVVVLVAATRVDSRCSASMIFDLSAGSSIGRASGLRAWPSMTPRAGMPFGRLGSHRFGELHALEPRV